MGARITDAVSLIAHGMMAGNTGATAFTSAKGAKFARFKAKGDNAGNVYVGRSGVTKAAASTDATSGWELDAGQECEVAVPGGDLANLYYICDNAGDDVMYQVFG